MSVAWDAHRQARVGRKRLIVIVNGSVGFWIVPPRASAPRESRPPGRIGIGHIDHRELDFARRFGVAERLAFIDAHLGLAREEPGQQLPDEEQDDAEMEEKDSDLPA